jgi:peptidoglycan/xylan/chitin deacetylase (PgdA/CDA1 family)
VLFRSIVKEVQARGHVIGNHTYTHPRDLRADSRAEMKRELEKCEEVIERVTGERARLFRPPWGVVDGTMLSIAEGEGYRTILWTLCADHQEAPTPALMAKRVAELVRPGDIVLLHDGTIESRIKDVEATPLIIEGLLAQGYRFVTVPKLLKAGEESEAGSWGSD